MTLAATSAFAPTFTHTAASPDFTLTFSAGTSPVTGTLTTGDYRMWLAASTGCYLRKVAAAVKAAILAARGGTISVTATLSADGIATFTFANDIPSTITFAAPMWRILGFSSAAPTITAGVITGARPVMYLALLSAVKYGPLQPRQAGGTEETTGGRVYAIAASLTSYRRKHSVSMQPTTTAQRTAQGAEATAMLPANAYLGALGSTSTAREWSVLDVLYASRNALCGIAVDNWPTLRTSTSYDLFLGYVAGDSLLSPEITAQDETWDAWCDWTLTIVLPTTSQTTTRA